jgi:DNA (cytosine-5)-methyltransferase 1
MKVGSLFSGIGGLDLGLERAGMEVIWQSEIDPYACRVLKKHWPLVPNLGNIKEIEWSNVERPDVICGGYPCQPFSLAGKRAGENDPRHLWPYVRNAISELRPRYAVLENVRGHTTLGGTTVIGELTALGYDAEWRIVSAESVGAPHRRDRLIIVAYPSCEFCNGRGLSECACETSKRQALQEATRGSSSSLSNSRSQGGTRRGSAFEGGLETVREHFARSATFWQSQPEVARMANGVPHRLDRGRGLGNAVVPQVAETIGRLVLSHAKRI